MLTGASWTVSIVYRFIFNHSEHRVRNLVHLQAVMSGIGRLAPRRCENAYTLDSNNATAEGRIRITIVHVVVRFILGKPYISDLYAYKQEQLARR